MLDLNFSRRDFVRIGSIGAGMSCIGLSDASLAEEVNLDQINIGLIQQVIKN